MAHIARFLPFMLLGGCAMATNGAIRVPTSPDQWGDLAPQITPTDACPGGTVEALSSRLVVSPGFSSVISYAKETQEKMPTLEGVRAGDSFHQFSFRQDLPDGGFWGFTGFLLARGGCIIHAQVTSFDN